MTGGELPGVNDLARIVKSCECAEGQTLLNTIYHVREIFLANRVICSGCYRTLAERVLVASDLENGHGCILTWTRRIPPLAELDSIDIVTEIESEMPRREKVSA